MTDAPEYRTAALKDIETERLRQIASEGWTEEHDDEHSDGEIALAAGCYAFATVYPYHYWFSDCAAKYWPWSRDWWKPAGGKRRCLIKAAALIVAEIERLDRKKP